MLTAARAAVFAVCALFILLAPAYSQVLSQARGHVPRWTMFSGIALQQLEVRVEGREPGKPPVLLDRYTLLGHDDPARAPKYVRRLVTPEDARRLAVQLCKRVPRGMSVHMRLRRATRAGWSVVDDGAGDVCARSARDGAMQ